MEEKDQAMSRHDCLHLIVLFDCSEGTKGTQTTEDDAPHPALPLQADRQPLHL